MELETELRRLAFRPAVVARDAGGNSIASTPDLGDGRGSVVPLRLAEEDRNSSPSSNLDSGRLVELDRRGGNVEGKEEESEREERRIPDVDVWPSPGGFSFLATKEEEGEGSDCLADGETLWWLWWEGRW